MKRLLAALLLLAGLGEPALGQGFDLAKGGDTQIQIYADDGIEWRSDQNKVIARGRAKAVRGTMTLTADTLTAYYRGGGAEGGSNEIWRVDADGNVTISTPTDTATGHKATYDLDKAIFVLRGQPAKLTTPTQTFTADEALEYWETEKMAVLRGNGIAIQKDRKIRADVLTAHFKDRGQGAPAKGGKQANSSLDLHHADAFGHVVLTTSSETVTGDRGEYNMETGIATVSGSVKITRGNNELNGGYAHVDLNSGISRLFGGPPGDKPQRVKGTFIPERDGEDARQPMFRGNVPQK
jgi:lipopolysaccharide export system protein LptA